MINTTEDMLAYWKNIADQARETGFPDDDRVASIFNNNATIHYLLDNGAPMGDQAFPGAYALMVNAGNGVGLIEALEASARAKGVEILLETKAPGLMGRRPSKGVKKSRKPANG